MMLKWVKTEPKDDNQINGGYNAVLSNNTLPLYTEASLNNEYPKLLTYLGTTST